MCVFLVNFGRKSTTWEWHCDDLGSAAYLQVAALLCLLHQVGNGLRMGSHVDCCCDITSEVEIVHNARSVTAGSMNQQVASKSVTKLDLSASLAIRIEGG